MNGKDGKPFKTREGGVLRLEDLIDIMNQAASDRLDASGIGADFEIEERQDIARKVGLAALKFADLQNQRMTNYIFDPLKAKPDPICFMQLFGLNPYCAKRLIWDYQRGTLQLGPRVKKSLS